MEQDLRDQSIHRPVGCIGAAPDEIDRRFPGDKGWNPVREGRHSSVRPFQERHGTVANYPFLESPDGEATLDAPGERKPCAVRFLQLFQTHRGQRGSKMSEDEIFMSCFSESVSEGL